MGSGCGPRVPLEAPIEYGAYLGQPPQEDMIAQRRAHMQKPGREELIFSRLEGFGLGLSVSKIMLE